MTAIDQTEIYQRYKGKWVALAKDEKTVLASGRTVKQVLEKVKGKRLRQIPILFKVPTEIIPYIGHKLNEV